MCLFRSFRLAGSHSQQNLSWKKSFIFRGVNMLSGSPVTDQIRALTRHLPAFSLRHHIHLTLFSIIHYRNACRRLHRYMLPYCEVRLYLTQLYHVSTWLIIDTALQRCSPDYLLLHLQRDRPGRAGERRDKGLLPEFWRQD